MFTNPTHYLEEAQNLCSEIAIINQGKIVTKGKTDALLSSMQQNTLRFRLTKGAFPASLAPRLLNHEAQSYVLGYTDGGDLTDLLTALRTNHCEIENVQTSRASLEDLFIKVTQ